jgi:hypothetical protein
MKAPRLKPESILFAVFLGALAAFPPISIDPSQSASRRRFHLTVILFSDQSDK